MAKPKAPPAVPVVYTANRLRDGRVVWLGPAGSWVEAVAKAEAFAPETAEAGLAEAKSAERRQLVVGVYAVEVALTAQGPAPLRFREQLRAAGPSVAAGPLAAAA